jgi:aldehyde dehydrogenase
MEALNIIDGSISTPPSPTPVDDPGNLKDPVGVVGETSSRDIEAAIQAAHVAFPSWAKQSPRERADYFDALAHVIEDRLPAWADLLTREHGKLRKESIWDLEGAVRILRYYQTVVDTYHWSTDYFTSVGTIRYFRAPTGVTAIIVPWNYPIHLSFLMMVPALLAGNTVVVKPATLVPLTVSAILTECATLLPPGVLNVINGSGNGVGQLLVSHPKVRRVALTGGTETGRIVMRTAADSLKKISMELGGNDPAILLEDVRLDDRLYEEIAAGVFTSTGQICLNIKRIYVHRARYYEFVQGFREHMQYYRVGYGLEAQSDMGPLNNLNQVQWISSLLQEARDMGAAVEELGQYTKWVEQHDGYYMLPTLVTNVSHQARIVTEEQFGPVVPIIPFSSWDEAVSLANSTEYGLASSIWTENPDKAFQLAECLEAGSTFINIHRVGASGVDQPFGGVKQSGIGRGHGLVAIDEATELHTIIHRHDVITR